ncbi:MAG: Flp family type IVb pilin [Comamonadaceae bacterium]|jgi:pilus assembly protein Flp/PilA|nr:Flp family type IVb pilin [Comamonadaceae bacterium]
MNQMFRSVPGAVRRFMRDEEGAQVVEYALIIAVVSIALVLALQGLTNGNFATFIARVNTCLTTATCT